MPPVRTAKKSVRRPPPPFVDVHEPVDFVRRRRAVSPPPEDLDEPVEAVLCSVTAEQYVWADDWLGGTMTRRRGPWPGGSSAHPTGTAHLDDAALEASDRHWDAICLVPLEEPRPLAAPNALAFPGSNEIVPIKRRGPYKKKDKQQQASLGKPSKIASESSFTASASSASPVKPTNKRSKTSVKHERVKSSSVKGVRLVQLGLTRNFTNVSASSSNPHAPLHGHATNSQGLSQDVLGHAVAGRSHSDLATEPGSDSEVRFTAAEKGKGRAGTNSNALASLGQLPPPKKKPRASVSKPKRKLKATVGAASNTPEWFAARAKLTASGEVGDDQSAELDIESARRGMRIRPRLRARPPVWAYSRQEMCETLPWWRAFQSGLYMKNGTGFGYLLDSYPAMRDTWSHDGRVVVSHGGGKCIEFEAPAPTPGAPPIKMVRLRADQSLDDPRVATLVNSCKNRTPIALVQGNNYQHSPFDLGCGYVVLGWYWVSFIWVEAEEPAPGSKLVPGRDYFHRYKIRFDWVSHQGEPWWTIEDPSLPNGWEPHAENEALQLRRAGLPEGSRPRMDVEEDRTVTQPPVDPAPRRESGDPIPLEAVSTLELASLAQASSKDEGDVADEPGSRPVSVAAPIDPVSEPAHRSDGLEQPHVHQGVSSFAQSSLMASSSSSGSHVSSNVLGQSPSISSETSFTPSLSAEDVIIEDAEDGKNILIDTEHSAPAAQTTEAMDLLEKEEPTTEVPRRLPGSGGIRKISSFATPSLRVIEIEPDEFTSTRPHQTCTACNKSTPLIYETGWMCVHIDCPAFFKLVDPKDGSLSKPPASMAFNADFIAPAKTPERLKSLPYSLVPDPPIDVKEDYDGFTSSRSFWRGMVCRQCNKASSRERWDCWECTSCHAIYAPLDEIGRVITPEELSPLGAPLVLGNNFMRPGCGISCEVSQQIHTDGTPIAINIHYILPDGAGSVWHIKPYNLEWFEAVFESYQKADDSTSDRQLSTALFKRHTMRQHSAVGRLLAQQFTFNAGEDYKYVVDQDDQLPFSEAPWAVAESLRLIDLIVHEVIGDHEEFNEILSVAYKDDQRMKWHDDGEHGLGPVVASLSLGSDADMSFRLKGSKKAKNEVFHVDAATREANAAAAAAADAPISEAVLADDTTAAADPPGDIKPTKKGKAKAPAAPKKPKAPPKTNKTALTLKLKHGDFVIMQGDLLQARWEHAVVPKGFRIAATARKIMEGHGKKKPKPKGKKRKVEEMEEIEE